MDRTVERIISEWREAERQYDAATDEETREALEARIAQLADEHRRAMDERLSGDEPPDLGGVRGAEA
jgi:hypothetical protein